MAKNKEVAEKKEDSCAKKGDVVQVHYTGKLESGEVFDSSKERQPIEFELGSDQLIQGFNSAVEGMKKGDKKNILLEPDQAYGNRDERRVQNIPREMLPKAPEPKAGMMLTLKTPAGQVFPARIEEVKKDVVVIDLNHPLAGKKLNFDIELVDIKKKKQGKDREDSCSCCS